MHSRRLALFLLALGALLLLASPNTLAGKKTKPPPEPANPEIAYVNPRKAQIVVADADGGNPTAVLTHTALKYRPTWAPDGSAITFEAYTSGLDGLWQVDVASGDITVLVPDDATFPAWSPVGDEIAYVHAETEIRLIPADRGTSETIYESRNGGTIHSLTFNADGTKLAFVERLPAEVFILDLATGELTKIHTIVLGGDDRWEDLDWSRTGDVLALDHSGMISTYDLSTGVLTELFAGQHPSWSPDDSQLVCEVEGFNNGLYVYTFATGGLQKIVRRDARWPDWVR